PSFHAVWIEGAAAPFELARAVRPAVTTLLWCDPGWRADPGSDAASSGSDAFVLPERLLLAATPALRPRQARLDLAAFRGAGEEGVRAAAARAQIGGPARERLRLQSRVASRVARRLSGATPERCDALQNTWSGPPPPDAPGALRRAPPWLDLEETRLTPGAFAPGSDGGADGDALEAIAAAAVPTGGPECAGVLGAFDVARIARIAAARRSAAYH